MFLNCYNRENSILNQFDKDDSIHINQTFSYQQESEREKLIYCEIATNMSQAC